VLLHRHLAVVGGPHGKPLQRGTAGCRSLCLAVHDCIPAVYGRCIPWGHRTLWAQPKLWRQWLWTLCTDVQLHSMYALSTASLCSLNLSRT